jgi:hypothetical protein
MPGTLYDMLEGITDETSFVRFLAALREDCETHERHSSRHDSQECIASGHWETHNTTLFLKSMEDWATRGDFAEGVHHGEPMLRRIATMLYVGRGFRPEDRP